MESQLAEFYIGHAVAWSLVFIRVLGLTMFAPLMSGTTLPRQFSVLFAAMFAVAVYAMMPPEARQPPPMTMHALAIAALSEVLIGAGIGLIAGLPLIAVEIAGQIIGYQLGFSVAQAANPGLDINLDAIGTMLFYIAVAIFVSMGGLEHTFLALIDTFGRVPVGGLAFADAPVTAYTEALLAATELAVRIAAPAAGVGLMALLGLAFIMRTMPQLNVLTISFPLKILIGVVATVFALTAISDAIADAVKMAIDAAAAWARGIGAA